ncbi:MAG: MarR family transcriptional regulator [Alphaproteobacteria bacterium]|nr:MAG: MarR family transcriptional regulator [Alphaproteobacteria bacterium]
MSDIKFTDRRTASNPLFLRDEEIREGIELLFYAYRDHVSDPDKILRKKGFGRAHHRVIHFVGRNPNINVAELLKILRITKQSLGRVLKQLVEEEIIHQRISTEDRRQRLLTLTEKGEELEKILSEPQRQRFARAYREAGPEAVAGFRKVLEGLINEDERRAILDKITRS